MSDDLTQDEIEEIYVQWKVGMTIPDLADQYEVSRSQLSRALKLYRLSLNGTEDIAPRQGMREGGQIKLSFDDETMETIYNDYAEGYTLKEIAAAQGVAPSTISENLKLWEALLDPEDRMTEAERVEREAKARARAKEAKKAATKKAAQEALEALQKSRSKKK